MPRWACEGCGQLTRGAFECQDGLVRGAGSLPAGPLTAKMGVGGVRAAYPRAFECQDGLVRGAGSLPAGLLSAKMGL